MTFTLIATSSFEPMSRYPEQGDLLTFCMNMGLGTAVLLMLVGAVYLMYGWSLFKGLVTLNAAAVGGPEPLCLPSSPSRSANGPSPSWAPSAA